MEGRVMRPGLRFRVLARDNYTCRYCGAKAPGVALHVDHVVPRARGGRDALSNLVTACQTCNLGKAAMVAEQSAPDLTEAEYEERVTDLLETARNWFWHELKYLEGEWRDLVGRRPIRRESIFLGELILGYGDVGVRRVLLHFAKVEGFERGELCEHEADEHEEACSAFVEFDLFEIRQTLMRWRRDGFA